MKKVPVVLALVLLCAASAFGDCGTLTNITEVVPLLHVGENVHFNFEFIGGTEPYHFALVAGALPPGVQLTGSGGLRGKPKQAGSFFAARATTSRFHCAAARHDPTARNGRCLELTSDLFRPTGEAPAGASTAES